jgi:hypothetical protein
VQSLFFSSSQSSLSLARKFFPDNPVPPPRLLDPVAAKARWLHDSIRTEQADIDWIRRFSLFPNQKHPRVLGDPLPYLPIQFRDALTAGKT